MLISVFYGSKKYDCTFQSSFSFANTIVLPGMGGGEQPPMCRPLCRDGAVLPVPMGLEDRKEAAGKKAEDAQLNTTGASLLSDAAIVVEDRLKKEFNISLSQQIDWDEDNRYNIAIEEIVSFICSKHPASTRFSCKNCCKQNVA